MSEDSTVGLIAIAGLFLYAVGIIAAIASESIGLILACIFLPPVTIIYGLISAVQWLGGS